MPSNLTFKSAYCDGDDAVANGDLTKKITVECAVNFSNSRTLSHDGGPARSFASEVTLWLAKSARKHNSASAKWKVCRAPGKIDDNVNSCRQSHSHVRNIAAVTTAVANGDLTKKSQWMFAANLSSKTPLTDVDQLSSSLRSDTRGTGVARKQIGRPAEVKGVAGTWKDPHR